MNLLLLLAVGAEAGCKAMTLRHLTTGVSLGPRGASGQVSGAWS